MTRFVYTGRHVFKRAGRTSPNTFAQVRHEMPAAKTVTVSGRASVGWTLAAWRQFASTRNEPLKTDLLQAIEELEKEETELRKKYRK